MAPRTKLIADRKHILETQRAPEEWEKEFTATEQRENLPPGFLRALALSESGWNAKAESPAGAYGLMQFMPATAAQFGVDRTDPISSIRGAGRYMRQLIDRYGGDVGLALGAYNGGPGNIDRWLETGHWNWNKKKKQWNSRPKENNDYAHIILGTMGYDYSNTPTSPKKKFVRNAKGENAPYILPDGTTGTITPTKTSISEPPSRLAQLQQEVTGIPAEYNVGLTTPYDYQPLDYEQKQEFLSPSASVLPISPYNNQSIIQIPDSDLSFTVPTTQPTTDQIAQNFRRGLITTPQYIR